MYLFSRSKGIECQKSSALFDFEKWVTDSFDMGLLLYFRFMENKCQMACDMGLSIKNSYQSL